MGTAAHEVERRATRTAGSPPRGPSGAGPLWAYFLITFAMTWTCWALVAARLTFHSALGQLLLYVGIAAPSLVSLALTAAARGRAGVGALLARLWPVPVAGRWVAFALGYTLAIKLAAALLLRVTTGAWPRFGAVPLVLVPFAIAVSTPVQAGEEIGWRGFALPRLAARLGLARASLLLGAVWALWHLPLFFTRDTDTYGQSFVVYTVQVIALSVAIAWLYAKTGGGLFLPMLFHAAVNNTQDIVPSATPGAHAVFSPAASAMAWTASAVLWACTLPLLHALARTEPARAGTYDG